MLRLTIVLLLLGLPARPTAARAQVAEAGAGGVLLERRLAEELAVGVGDTVYVRGLGADGSDRAMVVEGIHERAADPSRISRNEYEARFHLADLEAIVGTRDRVDRFAVVMSPGRDAGAAARWIESLAFGTSVYETARVAEESSTTFSVVSRFHDAIAFVTLLASGIFLVCLMIVRVDERRKDVATMRLVGISRWTVVRTVVAEAVIVAVAASAAGAGLGVLISAAVNRYYAGYYDTTLRFAIVTPRIVILSVVLGIVLGVAAGVAASWRATTVDVRRLGER